MRGALALRISDGVTDRLVTKRTTDLTFSKVAPGGHEALNARINAPRSAFPDLGPLDRAYLYDTRTGRCVLDAFTANPTPVDGQAGQAFDLAAVGGMTVAADKAARLIYVNRDQSVWVKDPLAVKSSSVDISAYPTDPSVSQIRTILDTGNIAATNDFTGAAYYDFNQTEMTPGAIAVNGLFSGKDDGGYRENLVTEAGVVWERIMSSTGVAFTAWAGDPNWPLNAKLLALKLVRVLGATNIADDQTYTDWIQVNVVGARVDRYGTQLVGPSGLESANTVLASHVVEDLLGRLLITCDPAVAQVTATATPINQLAWPDGATAQRVLDELARWEPDMLWEILDSTAAGHRFAYRPWPTEPRYEISVRDGYRETGSDDDLVNRVVVTWTDAAGAKQTTIVTATADQYPVLADLERAGRTRDADAIMLEDGFGSEANAITIGTQKLASINNAATAASAVVRRRVYDHLMGCDVDPWEIEPGYVAHVRELGKDLRLTRMEYTDASCSTALTLGQPVLTDEQRIARLEVV